MNPDNGLHQYLPRRRAPLGPLNINTDGSAPSTKDELPLPALQKCDTPTKSLPVLNADREIHHSLVTRHRSAYLPSAHHPERKFSKPRGSKDSSTCSSSHSTLRSSTNSNDSSISTTPAVHAVRVSYSPESPADAQGERVAGITGHGLLVCATAVCAACALVSCLSLLYMHRSTGALEPHQSRPVAPQSPRVEVFALVAAEQKEYTLLAVRHVFRAILLVPLRVLHVPLRMLLAALQWLVAITE